MARLPIALGNNEDEIVGLGVMNLQPSPQSWQIQREQPATRSSRTVQSGRAGAVTEGTFWTDEWLKGWAASLALHAALLTSLGLWYFVPPQPRVITIDSRLAGSPSGSPEGTELVGGLGSFLDDPSLLSLSAVENPDIDMSFEGFGSIRSAPLRMPATSLRRLGETARRRVTVTEMVLVWLASEKGARRFVEFTVKVGDPQFTLLWDTDADLDLHVIEPGGKEIYWESPKGAHGGELDVDNTKGFGPENIYWLVESGEPGSGLVKGPGPPGSLSVVRGLLGRLRRDPQADALESAYQARRNRQGGAREVPRLERKESDLHPHDSARPHTATAAGEPFDNGSRSAMTGSSSHWHVHGLTANAKGQTETSMEWGGTDGNCPVPT
jgi:hypothetical protein